mgnify:FL=1
MKKIITINDESYMILGTASVDCGWTTEELKSQYSLADAVLRNGNEYYICSKLINAEWKEIA